MCVPEMDIQVQTKNNFMMDVPRKNNLIMETRTVKLKKSNLPPVEPAMDMWSNRPAMAIKNKMLKKQMPQEDVKNFQENINRRPV